jgi:molybdopterin converting factor small subunit
MQIKVLAFAQARLALGFSQRLVEALETETPRIILRNIAPEYLPDQSTRVAVNQNFAEWDAPVGVAFEMAIIPMVSGG